MLEVYMSLIKTVFQEWLYSTSQYYEIHMLIALPNTSINRKLYCITSIIYLIIYLLNVIQIHLYSKLNLLI